MCHKKTTSPAPDEGSARGAEPRDENGPITVKEAAAELGLSPKTVYLLVSQGRITVHRPSPGRIVIYPADLDAYKRRCRHPAQDESPSQRTRRRTTTLQVLH